MAIKVLIVLLASHCVPAAEVTSLMAPNYAKVFRTGSIISTKTETENIDTGHYDRQIPDSDVTTEASDFYNVYYPVMEAQTVISSNDTQTVLQTSSAENSLNFSSEPSVKVIRLNPLAYFINSLLRQPTYTGTNSDEKPEPSPVQQSASDELSSQPDTKELPSALNQPVSSYQSNSYGVASPRLYTSDRPAAHPNQEDAETNVNSHKYPLPANKSFPLLKDSYQTTTSEDPHKLKEFFQSSKYENSYELQKSYQPIRLENSQKLMESYDSSILKHSQTPTEPHQHATVENPYKLVKERNQISPSEDEDDEREGSKSKNVYSYDSFKSKVSPNEEASPPRMYQQATGRQTNLYTYFYVGRKLWYVPLFFSVYFMFYVLALVVKSISRHKIVFPVFHGSRKGKRDLNLGQTRLDDMTHQVTTALETTERLYT